MLVGGVNSAGTVLMTTMVYTPGTGWATGPSMATARANEDAVLLDDSSILIVGGTDQSGAAIGTSERYVPGVGWDSPVSLATSAGATYHTTARLGSGKFLLAMQSASQIYNPSMKQWSSITSTGVYYPQSASLGIGKVLVLGGTSIQVPNAQLYDETSGWTSAPTPTFARYPNFDVLIALATGDALVAGGIVYNNCNSTNDAEVFRYCPFFTFGPASLPSGSLAVAYSQSIGASGGTGTVTYAVTSGALPAGLTLASNGMLSGTPSQGGTFPFTVTATDAQGCAGSKSYSPTISCPTITVSPTTLPYGRGGSAYDQVISSTCGTGAVTYAVTSGALPAGLTLASDGTLSGTPTVAGTFNFAATATDAATCKGSQSYSLPIYCPSFTFSPSSLANGTAGTPYTPVMIVANGALGAATYVVDNGFGTPPMLATNRVHVAIEVESPDMRDLVRSWQVSSPICSADGQRSSQRMGFCGSSSSWPSGSSLAGSNGHRGSASRWGWPRGSRRRGARPRYSSSRRQSCGGTVHASACSGDDVRDLEVAPNS